jgi:hypothetical protein
MALDRQAQPGHGGDARRIAGARQSASFFAPMKPRDVSTPAICARLSMRMPFTSQFWMMSTPR